MNVFESLLDELEEENLLEKKNPDNSRETSSIELLELKPPHFNNIDVELDDSADEELLETEEFLKQLELEEQKQTKNSESDAGVKVENFFLQLDASPEISLETENRASINSYEESKEISLRQRLGESEVFRKHAIEEVSCLQMVDNIFSSIEREQLKIVPNPYNDLPIKQILHSFLQLSGEANQTEHARAESELLQEAESWYSILNIRDQQISVQNLRYCCETTRPPLSPPALLALARFYRNSPFSEVVRNKFDLIITRLFSRDIDDEKRNIVFSREELSGHLLELYSEWESVILYSTKEDDPEITSTVSKFEALIAEAHVAQRFDELIEEDFFNRVRALKKSAKESFYAPQVAAIAIECNVEIGNRYLDLLRVEQETANAEALEEKYGFAYDQSISDVTNKSVQLVELLKYKKQEAETPKIGEAGNEKIFDVGEIESQREAKEVNSAGNSGKNQIIRGILGVNKFILALTVLSVLLSVGFYLWVKVSNSPSKKSATVVEISLEDSPFKEYIGSARVSSESFFAITTSSWDNLTREKKEEIVKALIADGDVKKYYRVYLLNREGLIVGSATQSSLDVK